MSQLRVSRLGFTEPFKTLLHHAAVSFTEETDGVVTRRVGKFANAIPEGLVIPKELVELVSTLGHFEGVQLSLGFLDFRLVLLCDLRCLSANLQEFFLEFFR